MASTCSGMDTGRSGALELAKAIGASMWGAGQLEAVAPVVCASLPANWGSLNSVVEEAPENPQGAEGERRSLSCARGHSRRIRRH